MVEHERIVTRRNELGISQAELARRVGVSQPMIVEIEKGRVQTTRFVIEIARALNLEPRDVDPRYEGGIAAQVISLDTLGELAVFNLVTRTGQSELLPTPINYLARPHALQHVRGSYAVMINDDVMAPEFEPGDVLLVNPHLPSLPGYSYVFRGDEGVDTAMVRRLIDASGSTWTLKAWNAGRGQATDGAYAVSDWPQCHRIIGKISRG